MEQIRLWVVVAVLAGVQVSKTLFPRFWAADSRWHWATGVILGAVGMFADSIVTRGADWLAALSAAAGGAIAGFTAIGLFRSVKESIGSRKTREGTELREQINVAQLQLAAIQRQLDALSFRHPTQNEKTWPGV